MTENVTKEIMDGRYYHATIKNSKLESIVLFTITRVDKLPGLIKALTDLYNKLTKETD